MYCVYVHTNLTNNKKYVGITNNIKNRWKPSAYKPDEGKNSRFYNAILKYGWEGFSHEILEDNLTVEEACTREQFYIREWKTQQREFGYNISPGGNGGHVYENHPRGMLGKHHTDEWKKTHSEYCKKNNPIKPGFWEGREHPRGMLGKHHTEEHKQRLREIPPHKHGSATPVRVIYPDGHVQEYDCVTYLCEDLGVGGGWIARQLKSTQPYKFSNNVAANREIYKNLDGCVFEKIENTEITD